jgi:hypothetical protein
MRKLVVVITALAALAAPAASLANASHIGTVTSGTVQGTPQGSKSVTQYKTAAYADPVYGSVSCSGTHHASTATTAAFDSFTCKSTNGSQIATPGQAVSLPSGYWWTSDFDGQSTTYNFSGTVSADGTSYTAVATYN